MFPVPKVRADYDELAQIAQVFRQHADNSRQTLQGLTRSKGVLERGGWNSRGAQKLYEEMNGSPTGSGLGPGSSSSGNGGGGGSMSSGGSGNGNDPNGRGDPALGSDRLRQVRTLADRYHQFVQANRLAIQNVLASNVNQYNSNPLMGATLHQLLVNMRQQLEQLWTAYDTGMEAAGAALGPSDGEAAIAEIMHEEWQALHAYHDTIDNFLDDLADFFQPYQQWVNAHPDNPMNRPVGGSIFPQYPAQIQPGDMPVAQSIQAAEFLLNYQAPIGAGRQPPHPGGDPSGRRRF